MLSEKTAIVVASFGTSYPSAVDSLLAIVDDIETTYPGTPVQMAFTSNIIRKKWHGRAADQAYRTAHPEVPDYFYQIKNVLGTLADFQDQGYKTIVVQPTHLTNGEEYLDLQSYINGLLSIQTIKDRWRPFNYIALGRPLMGLGSPVVTNETDLQKLAAALQEDVALAKQQQAALIYMGHGNEHLSTGLYTAFERVMNVRYPQITTLVGLVEGHPDFTDVVAKLHQLPPKKVILKPLMVVAGDHASNDMAGDEPDSWASQLRSAGFDVTPIMHGLGDNAAVRTLFVDHLQDAATEAGIELR
ncbi:MAG: sirohydrochlorin cobaltochelatase [Desulfuromonas sp.]|nr:MAG: sirohydrochlorin cobaltochelatase [Desulfuromonas sp.]